MTPDQAAQKLSKAISDAQELVEADRIIDATKVLRKVLYNEDFLDAVYDTVEDGILLEEDLDEESEDTGDPAWRFRQLQQLEDEDDDHDPYDSTVLPYEPDLLDDFEQDDEFLETYSQEYYQDYPDELDT